MVCLNSFWLITDYGGAFNVIWFQGQRPDPYRLFIFREPKASDSYLAGLGDSPGSFFYANRGLD